jgi:hypothetical protein
LDWTRELRGKEIKRREEKKRAKREREGEREKSWIELALFHSKLLALRDKERD